jgi:hypothetical protein
MPLLLVKKPVYEKRVKTDVVRPATLMRIAIRTRMINEYQTRLDRLIDPSGIDRIDWGRYRDAIKLLRRENTKDRRLLSRGE